MAKTNAKAAAVADKGAADKGAEKPVITTINAKAVTALEKAKKIFADANKRYQEQRTKVTKAKRLIATGDKKLATLEKKIEETKDAPSKAAEILLKKAADMEAKAKALEAEEAPLLDKAAKMEGAITTKEEEFSKVKETSEAELEALGVSAKATRTAASGTTAERRAKNNFQYRLKSKDWELSYNVKGRIESATKYGLLVDFRDDDFTVSKDGAVMVTHPYGEGSLSALAVAVKEHGVGVA